MILKKFLQQSTHFSKPSTFGTKYLSTSIFSWGQGNDGQLGHYPEKSGLTNSYTELAPRPILSIEGTPVAISCGSSHSAAILEDGSLWTWGKNDYNQLGHGPNSEKSMPIPTKVEALSGVPIKSISCGFYHTAAVDNEGRVWTWGYGGSMMFGQGGLGHGDMQQCDVPTLVEVLEEDGVDIVSVACGESHTLALSSTGEVWSWGKGEYGRLGIGGSSDSSLPELVDLLNEMENPKATAIAAGHSSSFAVMEDGKCFAWGRNDQGQLGLGGTMSMDVYSMEEYPTELEALNDVKIAQIAAGDGHTLALTDDGTIYQWGMRSGLMAPEEVTVLSQDNIKVLQCAAGANFSAAVSESGAVYTWGKGIMQREILGHGVKEGKKHPTRIETLFEKNPTCVQVACGSKHTLVF
eukprot:g1298.t1